MFRGRTLNPHRISSLRRLVIGPRTTPSAWHGEFPHPNNPPVVEAHRTGGMQLRPAMQNGMLRTVEPRLTLSAQRCHSALTAETISGGY
jgi:hypothetical protein